MLRVPRLVQLELLVQGPLLDVGQDADPPGEQRPARVVGDVLGEGVALVVVRVERDWQRRPQMIARFGY